MTLLCATCTQAILQFFSRHAVVASEQLLQRIVAVDEEHPVTHVTCVVSKKALEKLRRDVEERRRKTAALNERVRRLNRASELPKVPRDERLNDPQQLPDKAAGEWR